jgi:muconate cycloisomerase
MAGRVLVTKSHRSWAIAGAEVWVVRVPILPGSWHGVDFPGDERGDFSTVPKAIIRLRSGNGIRGVGECPRGIDVDALIAALRTLIGTDPSTIRLDRLPFDPFIAEGIEIALLDLVGRLTDLPAHRLLGGACRDRVSVCYCIGRQTPAELAQTAKRVAARGFTVLKMKCVLEDPLREKVIAATEATNGALKLRFDPNERFRDLADALAVADLLNGFPIECFESPLPQSRLDWYRQLRSRQPTPIALHLEDPKVALEAITEDAVNAFNFGGGPTAFVQLARLAEAAAIPVWRGSGVDLGIADAAAVHACAAAPNCTLPSDLIGHLIRVDDLITTPLDTTRGAIRVPDGPGLGVDLDEDAVHRYSIAPPTVLE